MCILFVHTNSCPSSGHYRIIIASNRDEFYIRKAKFASKWCEQPQIFSGLDLEPGREGGTWLGMSLGISEQIPIFRIGALLNIKGEINRHGVPGRGFVVTDYLKNVHTTPEDYVKKLQNDGNNYNGFNFIGLELRKDNMQTFHYSNIGPGQILQYGAEVTLGFGNSLPDKPLSKVNAGVKRFEDIIKKFGDTSRSEQLVSELINMLKWDKKHLPDQELKRRAPNEMEYLSSIYVHIPQVDYGTRTHTIILVDWEGHVEYIEETMDEICYISKPEWIKQHFKVHL